MKSTTTSKNSKGRTASKKSTTGCAGCKGSRRESQE